MKLIFAIAAIVLVLYTVLDYKMRWWITRSLLTNLFWLIVLLPVTLAIRACCR